MKDYTLKSGVQAILNNRAPLRWSRIGRSGDISGFCAAIFWHTNMLHVAKSQTLKL